MHNDRFEVGETAIIVNCHYPEFNGREVTIKSPLKEHKTLNVGVMIGYEIDLIWAGLSTVIRPQFLKKKRRLIRLIDQKVAWKDCPWSPQGAHEEAAK